jgi:hypothetical protein
MYILLKSATGQLLEGALLAARLDAMSVALRGRNEILELRLFAGEWIAGPGERFEIEAMIPGADAAMSLLDGPDLSATAGSL